MVFFETEKLIESMKKSEETRKAVISETENGKLSALQVENVIQSLEKMKLWVTRAGEAYHVASCRFTRPPHSSTAMQYGACGEFYSQAVRAVLSSTVKSNSPLRKDDPHRIKKCTTAIQAHEVIEKGVTGVFHRDKLLLEGSFKVSSPFVRSLGWTFAPLGTASHGRWP